MPLFEYQCDKCGHAFEELVFNSSQQVTCPKCQATEVSKKLSVFAASGGSASSAPSCGSRSGCGSGGFS